MGLATQGAFFVIPVHSIPVPLQVKLRPGLMKVQTWVILGLQMFLLLK